jgi:hypothetical protein
LNEYAYENISGMKLATKGLGSAGLAKPRISGGPSAKGSNQWILAGFHDGIFCKAAPR